MSENPATPEFDELASLFWRLGGLQSPSQIQGYLAGQLAAGRRIEPDAWLQQSCSLMEAIDQPSGDDSRSLLALYAATLNGLGGEEMDLTLVLPEEDAGLPQRTQCLGDWCQGFLAGFAFAGKQRQQEEGNQQYSKDVSEALSDMAAISQIAVDDEEPDDKTQEANFFEVAEYVRLAAINVFLECNQAAAISESIAQPADEPEIGSAAGLFNSDKLH